MEEYDKTMETVEVLNTEEMAKSLMLNYAKRLRDRSNSLQWQNDAHHTLLSILEFLSGMRIEYVTENGREKARIVRVSKPQINSTGVLEIAQILSPVLNKDVIFSNLDSKEMSHFMRSYCELITFNLAMKYDDYEIDKSRIWRSNCIGFCHNKITLFI